MKPHEPDKTRGKTKGGKKPNRKKEKDNLSKGNEMRYCKANEINQGTLS
jgi:hypothetical protein